MNFKKKELITIKTKRLAALITAFMMAVTIVSTGTTTVFADEQAMEAGLKWHYRDSSNNAMTGVSAPTLKDGNIYVASAKNLYKIDAETGSVKGQTVLTGTVGYNKLAPTVADTPSGEKVFVPLGGSQLNIVNAETMEIEKSLTYKEGQSGHQSLTPAVYSESDNSVYLGSWRKVRSGADYVGGTYVKVSLDDGTVTDIVSDEYGFYWSGACVTEDYVLFGSSSDGTDDPNTPSDGDASIYVYDKTNGSINETVLENSGSICSTVVAYDGKFYFTAKCGKLYEAEVENGVASIKRTVSLAGKTTCTPLIEEGKVYVGSANNVEVVDIANLAVIEKYEVPADVKSVITQNGKIYATYNSKIGAIYDVTAGTDYFIPESTMQNYCISSIAKSEDGTMFYTNDSNNLMAVKEYLVPKVAAQKTVTAKLYGYDDFKVTWSSQKVINNNEKASSLGVKYKVEYKTYSASKWTTLKSAATSTSCQKANLSDGVRYAFKVTPYITLNGRNYYGEAKATTYQYTLKATAKPTVKKASAKNVKVSWSKVNGITGYKVYRSKSQNKNFKCVKTVKSGTLNTKMSTSKKVKYYYRVRPYKKVGDTTILGPWSTTSKAFTLK